MSANKTITLPVSYEACQLPMVKLSHYPVGTTESTPVIIVTLNRPEKSNAFTPAMAESLEQVFRMFHLDERVKVVVLTGAGKRFCAGADLDMGFGNGAGENPQDYRDTGGRVAIAIHRCQKPTIAAMQGSAVGVGMTMTLPAAIRICHEKSKYGFVFTRRGITPESCSSYFLPRLIGLSRAMFLISTGGVYPPQQRYFGDLFTETLPDASQVLPRALELAVDMAENVSPMALAMGRSLLWEGVQSPEEAHLLESRVFHHMMGLKDHHEGVLSFMEKRKPDFKADLQNHWPAIYPWWYEADIDPKHATKGSKL
ncbi:enoyl-CoA hydratase/isomerase family protein [Aspergillus candidus]|uniref:Enoyl-CoA hydratase/isomerase family protein n=1 Tax=Aspergillus candidus TaxID=41067 RepID=A0A2I2EZ97_ASPCN|nr:enoyl-CoA hydratase/isomerase family protein [Aspergillus candidus]PLB33708.1 enoyl-CoA hydratase/isomerase family protein [Aspergillus candidus]